MDIDITSIVVAIISAAGGIVGAALAVTNGNKERDIKDAQREQRQLDRLDRVDEKISELRERVEVHNGYAEKFAENSKALVALSKDIEYLKNKK